MVYRFRDGFHVNGDAQQVGEALEKLRNRHHGRLTAGQVVAAASRKRSPLHRYFEWDDTAAARKYRLSQATYLIRAVVVAATDGEREFEPVRAFVCISAADERPKAFTHVCEAMADADLRHEVLARAKRELRSWRKRYADLAAFAELFPLIDRMIA